MSDRDRQRFSSADAWRAWLDANHAASDGVWLEFAKKGSGETTLSYDEALDGALAYGWIDSQVRRLDARFYLQRFTPRRTRSPWSKRNRELAEAMIAGGRMQPAGLAEVERAQADGRWERAYDSPANATVPDDLQAALDASPKTAAFWETLNKQNRYAITYRLQDAKRPETRARRLEQFVAMLERGEKLH